MKKCRRWLCLLLTVAIFASSSLSGYVTAHAAPDNTVQETVIDSEQPSETPPSDSKSPKKTVSGNDLSGSILTDQSGQGNMDTSLPASEVEISPEAGASETTEETTPYENYMFGDPHYNGNYVYKTDAEGNEIYEMYEQDLDAIISMAEEGMDLANFFRGSIFSGFTLEDLLAMKKEGYTFEDITHLYTKGSTDIPEWLGTALYVNGPGFMASMLSESPLPNTLTGRNWVPMSQYALGIIQCLGGSKTHGFIGKLKATGDDGQTYEVFCLSYGGTFRSGYVYQLADYSNCNTPGGTPLTSDQAKMLGILVNVYLNMSLRMSYDYSATQLMIWYIINNVQTFDQLDQDTMFNDLAAVQRAINGDAPQSQQYLKQFLYGVCSYLQMYGRGEGLPYGEAGAVDVHFWNSGSAPTAQNILSWSSNPVVAGTDTIPYIDNFYMERTATTEYKVEVTKESIITNELLDGIQFEVIESEASGYDLTYDIYKGTYSQDGGEYRNATINPGSFGQTMIETDSAPYMDNDLTPSGGEHKVLLITDENGYATTLFTHSHTFKEFYSVCYASEGVEIDYGEYQARWHSTLTKALNAPLQQIEITYNGLLQTMTYDELKEIYDSQQVVYTQSEAEATDTINSLYDAYCARTYTYTVTELDTYTRPTAMDSNGNTLSEISLPKDGFRKDVQDATTVGSYEAIVKNGGTMISGGKNDKDPNTNEVNVTNEPWYNQLFINKTDLETNNQILYDTEFEIYEYYQYKVLLSGADQKLYPAKMLTQYMADMGSKLAKEHIKAAKLVVTDDSGNDLFYEELDVSRLVAALSDTNSYVVDFSTTYSGDFTADLQISLDQSLDLTGAQSKYLYNGLLINLGDCSCGTDCGDTCVTDCPVCSVDNGYCTSMAGDISAHKLYTRELVTKEIDSWDNDAGTITTSDGTVYTYTYSTDLQTCTYTFTDASGSYAVTNTEDKAGVDTVTDSSGVVTGYILQYLTDVDSGIYVFSNGTEMRGFDENYKYISITADADNKYTLKYYVSSLLDNGDYSYKMPFSISPTAISTKSIDKNISIDPDDYSTWGQDNYEIVRVTPEIAKKMGWSDITIGMYTVHRLSATDQYCGTTFSDHYDEANKAFQYGYYEYGTLYYTQANQGKFAIVEKKAPSDASVTGYLGNYSDRDYNKLSEESQKKNTEGAPYTTSDQMSAVKMVHYLDLCTDTNQYATYMLTDGYKEYDATSYTRFIETIKNENGEDVATGDGYDAHIYDQSSLSETIGLERYKLNTPLDDVLNTYWDTWFSEYMTRNSGISVIRDSQKTETWMELKESIDILHHYVDTTINADSFDDNNASLSDIAYNGTYTDTNINYHSYAGEWAEALNTRSGFNSTEYLQVGTVTFDNAAEEKQARYFNTEGSITKDASYAFIDEREYGYIRFSKYDTDAERYVTGDLSESYEAGTDHADADLDGAVYSLYVDESNSFDVEYLEGTLDNVLFWAQPLNTGGYRLVWDGDSDASNGFTDKGDNPFTDYPHAYMTAEQKLYLDYTDIVSSSADVAEKSVTYFGIQHPDGQYGGSKHNGFFAVLEEQQVFVDTDHNGYSDTWTLQDVTLYAGAKVASATITDGELEFDGLYLGSYYLAEEIRDAITIYSTNNNEEEAAENRWLSFAAGYTADTDSSGNPAKYYFHFPYIDKETDGTTYAAEQDYVHKDTAQVSNQQVIRGGSAQFNKITSNGESSGSSNTTGEALEGAGFTVYLLSELNLITDGTIAPAYSEATGHALVEANHLVKQFDAAGNMSGYEFTKSYMRDSNMYEFFQNKYPDGYDLNEVNQLVYVKDHGYYYIADIMDAYRNAYYDNNSKKWDFSGETQAIARIYEEDEEYIADINKDYDYVANHLNSGSPCEYYGINGLSEGWVATDVKNEYRLSEIFTNHYGNLRTPELSWGTYILVETTTPEDVFTADPIFFAVTDSSASENRSKKVTISDAAIVSSLILVKRDAQSGQDVQKAGTSYRIWDYQNNCYVSKYLLDEEGALSVIAQRVFSTDEDGRINAVASLERGHYRIEELSGPNGYHNLYWDYGNATKTERLGGIGDDYNVATEDNMFQKYYGTMDFEVTTDRLYKASGIVSSANLDYLYIGESFYNDELQGKLNIIKTGEVLVGYQNTDHIEYADEYTASTDPDFYYSKSMIRERSVFESMKDHYDLGTDEITTREISIKGIVIDSITPVSYIASDAAGMGIAAIYTGADGTLLTMNGGTVYQTGASIIDIDNKETFYPEAVVTTPSELFVYETEGTFVPVKKTEDTTEGLPVIKYIDASNQEITDSEILDTLKPGAEVVTAAGDFLYAPADSVTIITDSDGCVMIVYKNNMDIYENAQIRPISDTYIYTVSGSIMDTSYLVTDKSGVLVTNDYGSLKQDMDGTYTLTYTEAIYDPDINYNYVLTLSDGSTKSVKLITGELYLSEDNEIITGITDGGYTIEAEDGTTVSDHKASISLKEENSGETFDFVYEERPLAGATYVIKAAEDIKTQDGGDNYWFRKGDIVATVTTANDGEIVSFAPVYNQGGTYDSTYYYGNNNGTYDSLTKTNPYMASEFATTGEVKNQWIASRMSDVDLSIFGIPAFTDETIYANTFYREAVQPIYRRFTKESVTASLLTTDYQTRLEAEGGLSSEGYQVITQTPDGFMLTAKESVMYPGATLSRSADAYILTGIGRSGETIDIEVRESNNLFVITEALDPSAPWAVGDYVERTESGYKIVHTDPAELGKNNGSTVDGAHDLGYSKTGYYANAVLYENGNEYWTLYDEHFNAVARLRSGLLVTEAGGIVTQTADGYCIDYEITENITSNKYVTPTLRVKGATLKIKNQEYDLSWDSSSQSFRSKNSVEVTFAPDHKSVFVTTSGETLSYEAFDMLVEYELYYAQKENIVRVEKDGTLGMVSLYLPLGSYSIEEIATPYGFLINEQVQTVTFEPSDQIKEIVFNTAQSSTQYTQKTMDIWQSKGLTWFVGGLNSLGEILNRIPGMNFFTWGTYGDGEIPFYDDAEGFINFFDLRVKAWSQEDTPKPTPADQKVVISKKDITTLEELPGAQLTLSDASGNVIDSWISTSKPHEFVGLKDGTYTLTEIAAPEGYDTAESVTFTVKDGSATGTIVMYDAPTDKKVSISKQDITTHKELPGAQLVLTDASGAAVDSWTSTKKPHIIENLADGKYTLTEITAPDGYSKAESITFTVKCGVAYAGDVVMYDAPEGRKVYLSKQDLVTNEELPGAKLILTDSKGNTIDSWLSTTEVHVIEGLADGDYTLTELMAPDGYEKAESITFKVVDGAAIGGPVVMYDRKSDTPDSPDNDRHEESEKNQWNLGVGIYKADEETGESLAGAKFALYTADDIFNADGKLIVTKDTLLAVATTDQTGHANFAVDIALMSKNLDPVRSDQELIYEKTISYAYDSFTQVTDNMYKLSVRDCDDVLLSRADVLLMSTDSGTYTTASGNMCYVDEATKTITYTIHKSIDGNTTQNTGSFYIKELTPPDGYLYDDTVYDVSFTYDDEYTMYIPVYAKHENESTKVTLTKMDLIGENEVPGATIAVYKIKDINNVNEDGIISHDANNLILIDQWVSTDKAHETRGLLLSNTQWPRLSNQEVRENIYVFREMIPAAGYVRSQDIEFKLYQLEGEDGWGDISTGETYSYEVLTRMHYCDQQYESGSIISPTEHADSWFLNKTAKESVWDYSKILESYTEVKWLLVNKTLVLFFNENTNPETISKILQEKDFAHLSFETVFLEFDGDTFDVDFHKDKQVNVRPYDSYLTYDQMWLTLDDIHVSMYDDTTKLCFDKQDIVTGEDVIGAMLEIRDAEGNVIDSWTTTVDEDGNAIPHTIEGVLEVEKEYILIETYAPTSEGYVKSNSIKFRIEDDGHIQRVVMQDDFTKLQISKADATTGKEVDGAMLELWSTDTNGKKDKIIEKWTTGQDGYDKNGYPNRHYIDYLPTGTYILSEFMAPDGYLLAEDVTFTITETGLLQKVQMLDEVRTLNIYKYRTGTTQFVKDATIQIYEVPEEYVKYLTDRIEVTTDAAFVNTSSDTVFKENTESKNSDDLTRYLTGVKASDTQHRDVYETTLRMEYSIVKKDLDNHLVFTQVLPKEITLEEESLDTEYVVRSNGMDAFTYEFGKTKDGYTITISFLEDFASAFSYSSYNLYLEFGVRIAETAARAGGSLSLKFADGIILSVPAKDILEVESELTEKPLTIKLTNEDLRATIKTKDSAVKVPGLTAGWYIALETEAPDGYILDKTPQVFQIMSTTTEQALYFYNQAIEPAPSGGGEPEKEEPGIGKLILKFGSGFQWNNVRTEDTGETGSSILLTIENDTTASTRMLAYGLLILAFGSGILAIVLFKRRKKVRIRK